MTKLKEGKRKENELKKGKEGKRGRMERWFIDKRERQ